MHARSLVLHLCRMGGWVFTYVKSYASNAKIQERCFDSSMDVLIPLPHGGVAPEVLALWDECSLFLIVLAFQDECYMGCLCCGAYAPLASCVCASGIDLGTLRAVGAWGGVKSLMEVHHVLRRS